MLALGARRKCDGDPMRSPRELSVRVINVQGAVSHGRIWYTIAAICIAVVVAIRPLGLNRDFSEYMLAYQDAPDRSARIMWSGLGFIWRILGELNVPFQVALVITTIAALTPKVRIIASHPYAAFWFLYYLCAVLLLHEYTQVRIALAMGCALVTMSRVVVIGTIDLRGLLWAAAAIWIHPSVVVFTPWWLCWSWLAGRPGLMVLLSTLPILLPLDFAANFAAILHPASGELMPTHQEWPAGNPLSARNLLLISLAAIGVVNLTRIPSRVRPVVGISLGCLSLWYATYTAPVIAHRVLELSLILPMFWVSYLPPFARRLSMVLVGCLGALLGYLFVTDPTFLMLDKQ